MKVNQQNNKEKSPRRQSQYNGPNNDGGDDSPDFGQKKKQSGT